MIYEFKVTLKDMPVPVWRKIQMDGESTFYDLHLVLQAAFNWYDSHLHNFMVNKKNGQKVERTVIEIPDEEDFESPFIMGKYDEEKEKLSDWFQIVHDKVTYMYDFGDDWEHEIVLTKVVQPEDDVYYPRVIAAKNATPPEDSRFEVISGHIDFKAKEEDLLEEINEQIMDEFSDLYTDAKRPHVNPWPKLLLDAKKFHSIKPWNHMIDADMFAVIDSLTQEILFCSILGAGKETFGLAVYIGEEGLQALVDVVENKDTNILLKQRSILMSYEDRTDLEKEDYALLKTYDVSFRGKKAWPVFISYVPGKYPWMIDEEEARLLSVALEGAMEVYDDFMNGVEMPDLVEEQQVYTKVPNDGRMDTVIANISEMSAFNKQPEVTLEVSELEMKRVKKLQKSIAAPVEFVMEYVDVPIQEEPGERPFFPIMVLAVEHDSGLIVYQEIFSSNLSPFVCQMELVEMVNSLGGKPTKLLLNKEIAEKIKPLTDQLNLQTQTTNYTSIAHKVLEQVYQGMK